jgi:ankyrin repeat protein
MLRKANRAYYTSWLVDNNANVNARNAQGDTPLHLVCALPQHGFTELIRTLLSNGADPSAVNKVCFQLFFLNCILTDNVLNSAGSPLCTVSCFAHRV